MDQNPEMIIVFANIMHGFDDGLQIDVFLLFCKQITYNNMDGAFR